MADHPTEEGSRAPDEVVEQICTAVTAVVERPSTVTELWADRGQILPRALAQLRPESATALVSLEADPPAELISAREVALGVMADPVDPAQVMVGVAPWRWAPAQQTVQTPEGRPVQICDDPAYLTVLRACVAMPRTGVMVVVFGLSFLARRGRSTVAANLHRFGVSVTGVVPVSRTAFRPTSGPGRVVVVLEAD